ncbi:MAG TPA: hypothetical protein VEW69_09330 [Alphaproteobacteria bacterium]|nr:hypothetical protein [Alphaproteobacteria bacterium]
MKKLVWITPLAGVAIALFIWIGGQVVMHLWNWNLPAVFGWREITFWQAVGLFALCRILFGDLGMRVGDARRSNVRRRIEERMADRVGERWEHMTPEERERFRQRVRERCGFDPAPSGGESKEK